MPPKPRPLADRFWEKVRKTDGCWEWLAYTCKFGYGRIGGVRGQVLDAHRVSWELHNGPIPEGICVLHHCDNPPCTNPDHLFLGTLSDNLADMYAKGRQGPRGLSGPKNGRFGKPVSSKTRVQIATSLAKPFRLIGPDGSLITGTNLKRFCRENGLNEGAIYQLNRGRISQHKGFRSATNH